MPKKPKETFGIRCFFMWIQRVLSLACVQTRRKILNMEYRIEERHLFLNSLARTFNGLVL